MLVLEKNTGRVLRVTNGVVQDPPVLDLAVNNFSERGLLGIALHPFFPFNRGVYLYWTSCSLRAATITEALSGSASTEKLYVIVGDLGRRGQLQNLEFGPTPPTDDDQFGGPEPDDAHLTGVILRLNDNGSAPPDNPFFEVGERIGGAVGRNIQKVFAYGIRNSFGMAVDPFSGGLWVQINGDDSFDEIQRVTAGLNSGWIQTIGPIRQVDEFKQTETTFAIPPATPSLQQLRWPPSNIADSRTRRGSGCSCCRAPSIATRSPAGASRWRPPASVSCAGSISERGTPATSSWARPCPCSRADTCSDSI